VRVGRRAPGRNRRWRGRGHVVELHHALRDIEGVMVGQRYHAGAELDALVRSPAAARKHFRERCFQPDEWCSAAPEFVIPSASRCSRIEVAAKLQHRMSRSGDAGRGRLRNLSAPYYFSRTEFVLDRSATQATCWQAVAHRATGVAAQANAAIAQPMDRRGRALIGAYFRPPARQSGSLGGGSV